MPTHYKGFGLEEILDDIESALQTYLNTAILVVDERREELDRARAERLSVPYEPIVTHPVEDDHFYTGALPSFIQSQDKDVDYPLVAVVPGRIAPDPENASEDQRDVYQNFISIHTFGKAATFETGELAVRRATRMSEAVLMVVRQQLHRIFVGVSRPMQVLISEPYKFPSQDGHGDEMYWAAVGCEYSVKNYSSL